MLLGAIRAAAAGYVLKGIGPEELVGAVRATLVGESPVDQELVMRLVRRLAKSARAPAEPSPPEPSGLSLTPRGLEVLRHLSEGETNRQIADALLLSLSMVRRHLDTHYLQDRPLQPHSGRRQGRRAR